MDLLYIDLPSLQTVACTFVGSFLGFIAGFYFQKWRW